MRHGDGRLARARGAPAARGNQARLRQLAAAGRLQAKRTIGKIDDPLEREADLVAERIVGMVEAPDAPVSAAVTPAGRSLQRMCSTCKEEEKEETVFASPSGSELAAHVPPSVDAVLASPGAPLDLVTSSFMEARFGADFSGVRVHTDADAAGSARDVGANAYTLGSHIAFAPGQYAPHATEGRKLLAHELAHVVQQGAAAEPKLQRDPAPAPSTELTEQDAKACSALYLQKLCVYDRAGFDGDRSGIPTPEEMAGYNKECRNESGYLGPDVDVSDREKAELRHPACDRGTPERLRQGRVSAALSRSAKYMPAGIGDELVRLVQDPVFIGSLAVAVGVYLALWLVPEPVFTKLAAAATTIAVLSTGAFTLSTLIRLANLWSDLESEASGAENDAQLEQAAEHFGKQMGAVEADLIVFLASLLLGGKLPGPKRLPTAPAKALSDAERAIAGASEGSVVSSGSGYSAKIIPLRPKPATGGPTASSFEGNLALKVAAPEAAPAPLPKAPPEPVPLPAKAPANTNAAEPGPSKVPVPPVVPLPDTSPDDKKKKRPPFVLKLPRQKAPYLDTYRGWVGVLQSDPNYVRGNPGQLDKWHQALRIGGSHGISKALYDRGHLLGLTEEQVRVPTWSLTRTIQMQVDHIVELQVTPMSHRDVFNSMAYLELLDKTSNGTSGPLIQNNIAAERQKQEAFDPSLIGQTLKFEQVELDGGTEAERWNSDQIRMGEHLDAYEKVIKK